MSFDLNALRHAVAEHGAVIRVVIAQARGSTPRGVGTAFLVWHGGQSGTIGGGRLEWDAAAMARKNLDRQIAQSAKSFALGPELGQCCGGAVTLAFERFTPETLPQDFPHAQPVMVSLSMPDEVKTARAAGVDQAKLIADWLVEPLHTAAPVWIWGAGHVGRALINTLVDLPVDLTWVDDSAARFPQAIPPRVTKLVAADMPRALPHAPPNAHHLILTYSHDIDLALCHAALGHGFASAGLIGSATKWARFQKRLGQLGHTPAQISRICCPIGDPALGKHPQAIAVGVTARLISEHLLHDKAFGGT